MIALEFQTYIERGMIEIPEAYQDRVKGHARVIILADEVEDDDDMIDFLLDHPYQIHTVTPLTRDEIYERR